MGLSSERFENQNADRECFGKITDQFASRIAFEYHFAGGELTVRLDVFNIFDFDSETEVGGDANFDLG